MTRTLRFVFFAALAIVATWALGLLWAAPFVIAWITWEAFGAVIGAPALAVAFFLVFAAFHFIWPEEDW